MYKWRTELSGIVVVTRGDGTDFIPTLTGAQAQSMDDVWQEWGPLVTDVGTSFLVQPEWVAAMVWQESKGNRRALRQEPNGWTGVGLLQITHPALKGKLLDVELMEPRVNLCVGVAYMRRLMMLIPECDFPMLAAAFNAGSVRKTDANEWGMVCTRGHIDGEVAALNYLLMSQQAAAREAMSVHFDLMPLDELQAQHRDTLPDGASPESKPASG